MLKINAAAYNRNHKYKVTVNTWPRDNSERYVVCSSSVNSVYAKFSRSFKRKTVAVIKTIHDVTKNDIIICIMHMIVMVINYNVTV